MIQLSPKQWKRLPIGSWPGHSRRAMVSFTTATIGVWAPSVSARGRPRRIGIPTVSK